MSIIAIDDDSGIIIEEARQVLYDGFPYRNAWVEVDINAITHNMAEARRLMGAEGDFAPVIKCNGYGSGQRMLARTVVKNGASRLITATLGEAVDLRLAGLTQPLLVFAFLPPEYAGLVIKYNITQTIYDEDIARHLAAEAELLGKRVSVHIKLETGLGRVGFLPDQGGLDTIKRIMALPGLYVEGIYSHFATADAEDLTYAYHQLEVFQDFLDKLSGAGLQIPVVHMANSAATIRMPESRFHLARGAALPVGFYPSPYVSRDLADLRFAISLKGRVGLVKTWPANSPVGYGCTYVTTRPTRVATLGVGYGDGYSKALSNKGHVLVHGEKAPIIGNICMDQMMVDVTDIPDVRMGDEVVFFGRQGQRQITVEELAGLAGASSLEMFAPLHMRLPRIYDDGEHEIFPKQNINIGTFSATEF